MAQVTFTANLQRHVACPACRAAGSTVAEVLDAVFRDTVPAARSYVLDEQGGLRQHMTVMVDGVAVRDRRRLSDPVRADSDVFILQALSGG